MGNLVKQNLDPATVASFGDEWSRFDQSAMTEEEARVIFDEYFAVFPWVSLSDNASGFDMGCGSGRWARLMAPKVGHLHCIDPSRALDVARKALAERDNVSFHRASVDDAPLPPAAGISAIRSVCCITFRILLLRSGLASRCSSLARRFWSICTTPSTIVRWFSELHGIAPTGCVARSAACLPSSSI